MAIGNNLHSKIMALETQLKESTNKWQSTMRTIEQLTQELETLKGTLLQRVSAAEQDIASLRQDTSQLAELMDADFTETPVEAPTPTPLTDAPRKVREVKTKLRLIFGKDGEVLALVRSGVREQAELEGYQVIGTHSANGVTYFKLKLVGGR